MLWSVHNPDGSRPGPLGTKELIVGLQNGAISVQAWVKRPEDRRWRPITSFEAFSDVGDPDARREPPGLQLRLRLALACFAVLFAFVVGLVGL